MSNANDTQQDSQQPIRFFEPLGSFDGALIELADSTGDDSAERGEADAAALDC